MIAEKGVTIVIKDTYIYGDKCKNIKISQKIDVTGLTLPMSTATLTLSFIEDYEHLFQKKEILNIYKDGIFQATRIVSTIKKTENNKWVVECEDLIAFLEDTIWYGDSYVERNAKELLIKAFEDSNVPYEIDNSLDEKTISGDIDVVTCRHAVMNICFAIGAYIDTSGKDVLKVKTKSTTTPRKILPEKILTGTKITEEDEITSLVLEAFGERLIAGEDILVNNHNISYKGEILDFYFTEPHGNYKIYREQSIANPNIYKVLEENAFRFKIQFNNITQADINNNVSYAVVSNFLGGYRKTVHTKTNPYLTNTSAHKEIRITKASLVNNENAEEILSRIFEDSAQNKKLICKIVEGKKVTEMGYYCYGDAVYGTNKYGAEKPSVIKHDEPIKMADILEIELDNTVYRKRVISQQYDLNSSVIVKECVLI